MEIMNRSLPAIAFIAAASLGARPAAAAADVGFQTGPVIGVEMPAQSPRPALGGVAHKMWNPLPALGLGIRATATFTSLVYGSSDGEPVIGHASGNNSAYREEAVTVVPSLAFAFRLQPTDAVRFTGALGVAFVASSEMGGHSLFPLRTAGAAVDVRLTERMRARAGVDLAATTIKALTPGLLLGHLGLTWDL